MHYPSKVSARCLAMGCLVAWSPLSAQTREAVSAANQAASEGLAEIIVTAQKREESLQDTPISIAVLSSEDIQNKGIETLNDFSSGEIPSLRITPGGGTRPSTLTVTMRGISPGDVTQISRDQTVGIYADGIYLGRAQGLSTELLDLERIEVLRGPQGTLFGRNAVAGAISLVSKRPTGRLGLDLTAGLTNFDGRELEAHVNLPEFAGISVKVDGVWTKRDGWVANPLAGQSDWYGYNRRGGRISALWQPADDIEILYSFDISRDESVSGYSTIGRLLPGAPALPPIFALEPDRTRTGRAGIELQPGVGKVQGHGLHASWEIADKITLRSITAYRELKQTLFDNPANLLTPFTPNGVFGRLSYGEVEQDQFSQELQLVGSLDRLDFVLGAFYFREDATDLAQSQFTGRFNAAGTGYTLLPVMLGGPTYPERASEIRATSKAVFSQFTYTPAVLEDRLHLTGGLRWTHDQKSGGLTKLRGAPVSLRFKTGSKRVDPAASVAFDVTDDVNSYVRWGRAYRAGGVNSRSATLKPFDEEVAQTWEIGAKTRLFNNRAQLNIAAYRTDYRDRQVDFNNPANPSNTETLNAPGSTIIKGIEVDLTVAPVRGLTLTGSYAYTDTKAPIDMNPFSGVPQEFSVIYTPAHSTSGSVDYEFTPFSFGTLAARIDAIYSGSFLSVGSIHPTTGSYFLLNGRVTLKGLALGSRGAKAALSLWGKNLTNEQYEIFQFELAGRGLANFNSVAWNEPRTYGIELRFGF